MSENVRNEALAEIGEGPWVDALFAEREAAGAWREVESWLIEYDRLLALSEAVNDEVERREVHASGWTHPMDRVEYHEHLEGAYRRHSGPDVVPPGDPEERDDFDAVKMKLERKIDCTALEKETITAVAERYYRFNDLRGTAVRKYRKHIADLTEETGDMKWSQQAGQLSKVYPDPLKGCENGKVSELYRSF